MLVVLARYRVDHCGECLKQAELVQGDDCMLSSFCSIALPEAPELKIGDPIMEGLSKLEPDDFALGSAKARLQQVLTFFFFSSRTEVSHSDST